MLLTIVVMVYWTFAVLVIVLISNSYDLKGKDFTLSLTMAVFWPLTVLIGIPMLIYSASVASTKRLRADLKNRRILRAFEKWLAEQDYVESDDE